MSSATAHLKRTLGTPTNRKKFTASMWIRKASTDVERNFFGMIGSGDSGPYLDFRFATNNQLELYHYNSGYQFRLTTNRAFRDNNAWYHFVFTVDTTLATADDRFKVYVNGTQETSFANRTNPSQDLDIPVNVSGSTMSVGHYRTPNSSTFPGQFAHVHFVDGSALTPSTFGETDATTGIWKAKTSPTVTYGTNGFFLKFDNSANMGLDSSGQSNNLTVSGTILQVKDTPSNIFSTINSLDMKWWWGDETNDNMSNFNTTVQTGNSQYSSPSSTLGASKGKYYWEVKPFNKNGGNDSELMIGVTSTFATSSGYTLGYFPNDVAYRGNGNKQINNAMTSYGNSYAIDDIIGVAMDLDNNKLYFSKNGTWQNSGVPTSGSTGTGAIPLTDPASTDFGFYMPSINFTNGSYHAKFHLNMGLGFFGTTAVSSAQNPDDGIGIFEYDVPAGYRALCTKSLNAQEYS